MKTLVVCCALFYVCYIVYSAPLIEDDLPCAKCSETNCTVYQNCELDTIPCGCCPLCSRKIGEQCEAFSPGCETGADCLTPGGLYDRRPPYYLPFLKGICIDAGHSETRPASTLRPTKSASVV